MPLEKSEWPQWLKDAETLNAIVERDQFGRIVWLGGVWRGGEWLGGEWLGGVWRGGVWRGGEWRDGEWRDGVWRGGVWRDGVWRGGEWRDGVWLGGEWRDGVWLGGEWLGGEWLGGEWRGGVWRGGEWRGGEWRGGVWRGGVWRGGVWRDGEWRGGEWLGGEWRDGEWRDGVWRGGVWLGGKHWKYYLMLIKADMQEKMDRMPNEVPFLKRAIIEGKIDGTCYEGDCRCFTGTMAKACDKKYNSIAIEPESDSPVEKFFLSIQVGDTPDKSIWAKIAIDIIDDWEAKRAKV